MSEYVWLTELSKTFLERDYLLPGQTVEERVEVICNTAEGILKIPGFAGRFKENLKKGWYSLSTPIWTNFGTERGLPISCFGSYIHDSMESILYTQAEVGMMTKHGGGTSAYFGKLRKRGSKIRDNGETAGSVHFMQLFDNLITTVSQGRTRRGNFATYLPIDHGDIDEFLTIRGDGSSLQHIFPGVCVSDEWLKSMVSGNASKRQLWAKVLESRANTGLPYIFFTDNANKGAADIYRENYEHNNECGISHSNLCTEIMLPDSDSESFVCDLSSMNVLHYDDWKNTDAVELLVYFLDAVMTEFIQKAIDIKFLEKARFFAQNHRALGIGWIGWHSYLQSKMIPFESMTAKLLNVEIIKQMKEKAYSASAKLATMFGEPLWLKGRGRRNTTLLAIAPTKSSSFILGQVSEGIEPNKTNYYIKDLQKGKFTIKNPYLQRLLQSKNKDTDDVWNSILKRAGSVQHIDFLSADEKLVFKTFAEISPKEVIIQAAQRQKYIDQGQSINLMIHPSIPVKDVNRLVLDAWEMGIKSLYYQHSVNAAQEFSRNILNCVSCES